MVRKSSVYLEEGEGNLARNSVWSSVGILCGSSTSISIFLITATEDSFECISASFKGSPPSKEHHGNLISKQNRCFIIRFFSYQTARFRYLLVSWPKCHQGLVYCSGQSLSDVCVFEKQSIYSAQHRRIITRETGNRSRVQQTEINLLSFSDVDECQVPSTCSSDLVCNNTVGSYRCECSLGYVEDPSSQNPVNVTCVGEEP